MKKTVIGTLVVLAGLLTACGNSTPASDSLSLKVGIRENTIELWEEIETHAKEQGLVLDLVTMSSSLDINQATIDGDLDANSYQTLAFMKTWNELHDSTIVSFAPTIIAPLGLYSEKIQSLDELEEGAKLGIPDDPSNTSRALLLLEKAGLLTLSEDFDSISGTESIESNPKKIEFVLAEGAMLPRMLPDLDAAAIINGTALDAGYTLDDSFLHEDENQTPYINVIGTTEDALDSSEEEFSILADVIDSEEIRTFIQEFYKGNFLFVDRTMEDVLEDFEKNYQ